ncbi:MAG TPA: histone deacetylase family protein [Ilumatobacter sp.]|nr:histone deacetylase family protein [Ilumatobacter sp.]
MKVVYSLHHRLHHPEREVEGGRLQEPFEHPGRAEIIRSTLAADDRFDFIAPDEFGTTPIEAVHDPALIAFLERAWTDHQRLHGPVHDVVPDVFAHPSLRDGMHDRGEPTAHDAQLGYWCFETTTPVTRGTYEAARSSVNVALTAADVVLQGDSSVYGLCRPPGHHATRRSYGGYCFFNNAAIAADSLQARTGSKVAVLDVDYHHGNGTQQIFYERGDVFVASLHADPAFAYPYFTGNSDERGAADGTGANVNFPMPKGTGDDQFVAVLADACDAIRSAGAETLVVSLGLDTYFDDPISDFTLTPDGFQRCGSMVAQLGLPTVVLQEGGYATEALGTNAQRWLLGLRQEVV